jgi:hypothetical protein
MFERMASTLSTCLLREFLFLPVQLLFLRSELRNRCLENRVDPCGLVRRQAQVVLELRVFPPRKTERLSARWDGERQQHDRRQQPLRPSLPHA